MKINKHGLYFIPGVDLVYVNFKNNMFDLNLQNYPGSFLFADSLNNYLKTDIETFLGIKYSQWRYEN